MKISKTSETITFFDDCDDYSDESHFVYENEEMTVDDLIHEMTVYIEPSDCPLPFPLPRHVWFTDADPEIDIETGAHIRNSWHIEEATDLEMKKLYILLKRGGV